ncbi:hypothetical protein [Colwellia sp. RSH04]|uniref:hypothetical protein n=1 Tax=Colwellia sp. RSH04 TaxID=2305464 RepID=UPI000E578032|nr:hypothetical protein [Colwellia sp. RSH04]RHW74807.1 hypothetical protein D1094_16795 [Colwellia sp. RSH04]
MKKLILALLFLLPNAAMALPTAKYTILVVDEQGVPIEGADASISFMRPKSDGWGGKPSFVAGKTDKDGLYTGQGATQQYGVYGASAKGYYGTSFKYNGFTGVSGILGFRKWQPWNPTLKVVLKKIKNPIPMYAYYVNKVDIPKIDEVIGYDLKKHDWVSPYGKGIISDLRFKLEDDFVDNNNYKTTLTLNFSNGEDGLQKFLTESVGSRLLSNHKAPLSYYQNTLIQKKSKEGNNRRVTTYKVGDNTNYYFRVRCAEDDLESCLYGKMYGNIEFSATTISFKYFLNPSQGDTNVEFDPKRNLFKKLKNKITTP